MGIGTDFLNGQTVLSIDSNQLAINLLLGN